MKTNILCLLIEESDPGVFESSGRIVVLAKMYLSSMNFELNNGVGNLYGNCRSMTDRTTVSKKKLLL